jgi:hypothetical protein
MNCQGVSSVFSLPLLFKTRSFWVVGTLIGFGNVVAREAALRAFGCLGSAYQSSQCTLPLNLINLATASITVGWVAFGVIIKTKRPHTESNDLV